MNQQATDHGPAGDVAPTRYPGGKDGWFRATCICGYDAWEAIEQRARKRLRDHLEALGATLEDEDGPGTVRWYGRTWLAPVCRLDAHVNTPVGSPCMDCRVPVEAGEQGVTIPYQHDDTVDQVPFHLDCFLRSIGVPDPRVL